MKAVLDSLDGLNKEVAKEYKAGDDGKFYLELEGVENHPSTKPLENTMRRAKEDLKKVGKERDELKTKISEVEEELNGLREGAIPKGDVEALKKSYQSKYDKDVKERDDKLKMSHETIEKLMVGNVARDIATKLAAAPEYVEVLLPHVLGRIKLEYATDGTPETVILGKDGKPSALKVEDLEKEVLSNKAFAPILRGSHSSGGSASGSNDHGSAGKRTKSSKDFDMSKATPAEIVAHRKAQQAGQ